MMGMRISSFTDLARVNLVTHNAKNQKCRRKKRASLLPSRALLKPNPTAAADPAMEGGPTPSSWCLSTATSA